MTGTRQPDYILTAVMKKKSPGSGKRRRGNIGTAWYNDKGGLSITLNPGVELSWRDMADLWVCLWPDDAKQSYSDSEESNQ